MLIAIITNIIKSIMTGIVGYYERLDKEKKSKANEFKSLSLTAQLKSIRAADSTQQKIRETVQQTRVTTVKGWNLLKVVLLLCTLTTVAGCESWSKTIYVDAKLPILYMPKRPMLADTDLILDANTQKLMVYASKLEAAIHAYNKQARVTNATNGYIEPKPITPRH